MATFLKFMQVTNGLVGGEGSVDAPQDLYVSPEELDALYGCQPTEQDIRAAMTLIHAHCNRPALTPCLYDSGPLEIMPDRQETRLPVTPVISIQEASGRFGQGRRDRQGWNMYNNGALAGYLLLAGSRPQWSPIDVREIELDPATGVIWFPNSWMLSRWNVVRVIFVSGYITIPDRVKLALFHIINETRTRGTSSRNRYTIGRITSTFSTNSLLTPDIMRLLAPFIVQSLF